MEIKENTRERGEIKEEDILTRSERENDREV